MRATPMSLTVPEMVQLARAGVTRIEIAHRAGICVGSLNQYLRGFDLPVVTRKPVNRVITSHVSIDTHEVRCTCGEREALSAIERVNEMYKNMKIDSFIRRHEGCK